VGYDDNSGNIKNSPTCQNKRKNHERFLRKMGTLDISQVSSLEDLDELEKALNKEEVWSLKFHKINLVSCNFVKLQEECDTRIEELLSARVEIEFQVRTLSKKLANLKPVEAEAKHFAEVIRSTAILAEDVSAKVRVLDKAKV
jgi:hypothetical protein